MIGNEKDAFPRPAEEPFAQINTGPFKILKDFDNSSYKLDLPPELKRRGIHPSFHASLLRIHQPNDDRRFPGRSLHQITGVSEDSNEWAVEKISNHAGKGNNMVFEITWKSGDRSWAPLMEITALKAYLEAFDVPDPSKCSRTLQRDSYPYSACI
jgi:hypothetical protein